MKKIAISSLPKLYEAISQKQSLILPVKTAGKTNFGLWSEGCDVDLQTLKTVKSAKDAFFPQSETLYTCKTENKNITITPEALQSESFVVFGIKACDVRGTGERKTHILTFYAEKVIFYCILAEGIHTFPCREWKG